MFPPEPVRRRAEPTMLVRQLSGGFKIVADPNAPEDPSAAAHNWCGATPFPFFLASCFADRLIAVAPTTRRKQVINESEADRAARIAAERELMDEKETDEEKAERLRRAAEEDMRKAWSEK